MALRRISGTLAASVTPLRDGGERLDEDAFEPLLDFYGASGIEGVLVLGTTGEGIALDRTERRRAAELSIAAAGALHVIVHCGAQTTSETNALAAHAAQAGADGVAVIAPPYFRLGTEELVEHLVAAAAACEPLPFYIYEFADRSGYPVPPAVVSEVGERAPNLVGMKVSDKPFANVEPYLKLGLDVFVGAESVLVEGLAHGAAGAVSGVAGAFPEFVAALVREPAAEREALVGSLRELLSRHTFQASVKAALALRGVPLREDVRAPLRPLNSEARHELGSELERLLGAGALTRPVRV
ncbi:MAG TPA: dihydrodipicolinate synthase family protein [Solirubrobacteraceae bacterium]|nr:dihydrodipicolinate synthase family protein [Solirubrobacteraceae bacterium]